MIYGAWFDFIIKTIFMRKEILEVVNPAPLGLLGQAPFVLTLLHGAPGLCDTIDSGPPGSAVPGILQARTLEWVAIAFSNT